LDRAGRGFVANLRRDGALSVLVVVDMTDSAWDRYLDRLSGSSVVRVGFNGSQTGFSVEVRDSAIRRILSAHGVDLEKAREPGDVSIIDVPGLVLTLSPRVQVLDSRSAPNVAGILEGSDPVLKDEYVVFSAHMDHIGIGTPNAEGDSINNGADDDGSGTIAVLEIAEAFASLPTKPKRSMIFLLVSGEEKGLWGSEYFVENPPVPVERMVADLNADMVGRNWPDTIVAIGMEHSDLGETLGLINEAHPELGMTAIDDIWPDERFYFRSDHYNFARKGVPVLFFFNGTHEDYHGRDDEVDRIDAEKAVRISRLIFYLGYELATRTERPRWNPESRRQIVLDP
jgi:Zn-dependent M28 family amino/carboxypeptidase